ncbi:glycerol-3-phosphate dehydrogenase, partial [Escherichia coli]|nr:glycerol-3-phosphate dehydrogenase [Escherichia coli]
DDMAIGGGRDMPRTSDGRANWAATTASATAATAPRVAILLDRYGTTARHIARHEGMSPTPLADAPDYTEAEIDWIVRHEHVRHLAD